MASYMISYQLNKQGQDYDGLHIKIKELCPLWCRATTSTWIVVSDKTSAQIRDGLSPHIDANDYLLVCSLARGWASLGLTKEKTDWLKKNL